jgi:hypothetical protein
MIVLELSAPIYDVYDNDDEIIAVYGTTQREMCDQKRFSSEWISRVPAR